MMKFLAVCLMALALTGCGVEIDEGTPITGKSTASRKEYPTVNLPLALRQRNWLKNDEGSCVHATMCSLFRWQGRYWMAEHWRQTYGGGEIADDSWGSTDNLVAKLEKENVRYAYTTDGDVKWLEWALSTCRGCGVTVMGGKHMVALVHFDEEWAGILDNNDVSHITWVPRDVFVAEWQNSNGWAVAPLYTPAPPLH